MKKVVMFCPTDTWGGIEKNVRLRAQFLGEKGYPVFVVLLKGLFAERFENLENVTTISVNKRGGDVNMFVVWNYVKMLRKIRPYAVFAALKKDWWLVSLAANIAKVPNTILYLGIKRKIKNSLKYRLVFNRLNPKVVVNSNSLKKHLQETTSFFDDTNLFRIYNGFDIPAATLKGIDLKAKFNLPDNAFIIGCAGRFSPQKGFHQLPEILSKLPSNTHVVHVGEGIFEDEIKAEIAKTEQADRIHYLGYQKNIHPFFKNIDVFLLCSRLEGMANVLNEALSHGKPAVSTKVDGSEELLDYGNYGILTEIGDTQAMAEGISKIMNKEVIFDPAKQRKRISKEFSMEQMITATEKLFFEA